MSTTTIMSAMDYDTLDDRVLWFKNNRRPFYFDAEVADGVTVEVNWEDKDLVDEYSQHLLVHVKPEEVKVQYRGPAYDRNALDMMGEFLEQLDDELGCLMDGHFRSSIHQPPTGILTFVPEWSTDENHVYSTSVPIRRDDVVSL